MHRAGLLKLIQQYKKKYPLETSVADTMVAFIESHEDCFERTQLSGHITGSAWVVNQTGTHVLLTHHRKLNRWLQLGGHADGQSEIIEVAKREGMEESGIDDLCIDSPEIFDLDIHAIPANGKEPEHLHYDVRFVLRTAGNEKFVISEESHSLAWVPIDDLCRYTKEASMLRMRDKWIERS
ncbi:MAG: NUDIX domain-containing protein [Gammaproteobacteria bacterium]|nr:MAG: NUDIX domain-containing protein [Gammaproteobacteria bacterium]